MQALPGHMVELLEELVEEGALNDLTQTLQDGGAPDNPEHIEAAQRIERDQSFRARRRGGGRLAGRFAACCFGFCGFHGS